MNLTNKQKGRILLAPLGLLIVSLVLGAAYYVILDMLTFTKEDWISIIMAFLAALIVICGCIGLEYLEE